MSASRRIGIPPSTAAEQLQRPQPDTLQSGQLQPLPPGTPGRVSAQQVGIADAETVLFNVIGDHGGVADPNPQLIVANALAAQTPQPEFVYSVGDIVYYNGDASQYGPQFYEPYAHVHAPILGIPGNHDGDPDPTVPDPTLTGIRTFIANLCSAKPAAPAADPGDEYGRDTQTQPYCDWTLSLQAVTIVGVWSNVPSGGHLYQSQTAFITEQLKAAPADRPLLVALHHPPYSIDAHHGGSAAMAAALDQCFTAAGRCPELVISGHVHDYQRFTRTAWGKQITYLVVGNSGYHNLHNFSPGATPGQPISGADPAVVYEAGDDQNFGYLSVTAGGGKLACAYRQVPRDGSAPVTTDTFTVAA